MTAGVHPQLKLEGLDTAQTVSNRYRPPVLGSSGVFTPPQLKIIRSKGKKIIIR